jgi:hypothetical protein
MAENGEHSMLTAVAENGQEEIIGDGGPATSAQVGPIQDVAVDRVGNLYTLGSAFADPIQPPDQLREIFVDPSEINFPATWLDFTSAAQTVSLANISNALLDLSAFGLTGDFSTDSSTTTCSTSSPVAGGNTRAV